MAALEIYATQPLPKRLVKTALHQAVLDGRLHQVRLLVTKHGVDVDCKDIYGRTPIMLACLLDNVEYGYKMVKILLKAGASMACRDNVNTSLLAYACMRGREAIVKRILKEDVVELNEQDHESNTPLMYAALSGNPTVVKLLTDALVRFDIAVDIRNKQGYTALLLACKYGHYVSAHILLMEASACPSLRDNEFFMNAAEWAMNSINCAHVPHGNRNAGRPLQYLNLASLSFERESTFYGRQLTPICQHVKPQSNPLGRSLESLRLPAIPSKSNGDYLIKDGEQELILNGACARDILLDEIDDIINNGGHREDGMQFRPISRGSTLYTKTSYQPAVTPHFLSVSPSRSRTVMYPDMTTIFDIYSDQYLMSCLKSRPASHAERSSTKMRKRVSIMEPSPVKMDAMEAH